MSDERGSRIRLWSGRFTVHHPCYAIGRLTTGVEEDQLQRRLLPREHGLVICTGLHTSTVLCTIDLVDAVDLSGSSARVSVPAGGWNLDAVPTPEVDAPVPLLGAGQWDVALGASRSDTLTGIEAHRIQVAPADDSARHFMRHVEEWEPPDRGATDRDEWADRWYPGPGTYLVTVVGGNGATRMDTETISHSNPAEWWISVRASRFSPIGDKWDLKREWALADSQRVTVADAMSNPINGIRSPIVAGPAAVRLLTRRGDARDIVDGAWVRESVDGVRLEVRLDP